MLRYNLVGRAMQILVLFFFAFSVALQVQGQESVDSIVKLPFFQRAETLNKPRVIGLSTGLVLSYTAVTIGLDRAWYAGYDRGRFHFFNDWGGWRKMDKFGHAMTTYFESKWVGDMYKWSGVKNRPASFIGFGAGMLFQTTLEVLDGFSERWGFSWGDMAFNTLGAGLYLGQELLWEEQRILVKMSTHRPYYSRALISAENSQAQSSAAQRAEQLYGSTLPELFFKEYNGQTLWLSVNPMAFVREKPRYFPEWLNVAVGYGIENLYGAERNSWEDAQGNRFDLSEQYPRYSQFYLSIDVDFERIPTNKKWLKTVFKVLNIFKLPAPALELNTLGKFHFHPFYF